MRQRDLYESYIEKVRHHDSTLLGNWHVLLGAATDYHLEGQVFMGRFRLKDMT
jgi:hypothetical protein